MTCSVRRERWTATALRSKCRLFDSALRIELGEPLQSIHVHLCNLPGRQEPYVSKSHTGKPRSGGIQRYLRQYALYSRNRYNKKRRKGDSLLSSQHLPSTNHHKQN